MIFKTDAGILQLRLATTSVYCPTNGEWYFVMPNMERMNFMLGASNGPWNNYDANLTPGLATALICKGNVRMPVHWY
jgi:hypothetical protein